MAAPTRAKRRLGSRLRTLRDDAEVSSGEAAAEIKASDATVLRYETGHVLPNWGVVRILLLLYGASSDDTADVERLYEAARDEPRPVRLPADVRPAFRRLVTAEREADGLLILADYPLPGLFQTEPYADALVKAAWPHRDDYEARRASIVKTRMRRQERLYGPSPLRVHAVVDQVAIDRLVGGAGVMVEQLGHLLALAQEPSIEIQVVPYDVGAYGTGSGGLTIVQYPEPDGPSGYTEGVAGGNWIDNTSDVARLIATFNNAAKIALSVTATIGLLQQKRSALEGHDDRST